MVNPGGPFRQCGERFDVVDGEHVPSESGAYCQYECRRCTSKFFAGCTNSNQNAFAKGDKGQKVFGDQGVAACAARPQECEPKAAVVTAAGSSAVAASSSTGVVEVSMAEDRPPPSALSSHPPHRRPRL